MISRGELDRLASLRSEHGILSAYIGIEPRLMFDRTVHVSKFKGAIKRFYREHEDGEARAIVERERERVLTFLERQPPEGRGLAIFACEPDGIWEVTWLDVRVPTFLATGTTTDTARLAQVLDEYPRFVVALVQRDRAQVFVAQQRSAREAAEVTSEVPGQHDQGGWSQARFQRHIDVHVDRHIGHVVEELERLYYERPFNRLAIGGTDETVAELRKALPDPIARRVIGTFAVDVKHETEDETLERARAVLREDERHTEGALVERAIDAAESGGKGTLGVDDTIRALNEGRVETLLVADGVTQDGSACVTCHYLTTDEPERCPVCGNAMERADVIDRAAERAMLSGSHVDTILGDAREWLLSRGGIGALLRY